MSETEALWKDELSLYILWCVHCGHGPFWYRENEDTTDWLCENCHRLIFDAGDTE